MPTTDMAAISKAVVVMSMAVGHREVPVVRLAVQMEAPVLSNMDALKE